MIRENGTRLTLNPKEMVVGDVMALKGGDQCFADCCLFECDEKLCCPTATRRVARAEPASMAPTAPLTSAAMPNERLAGPH